MFNAVLGRVQPMGWTRPVGTKSRGDTLTGARGTLRAQHARGRVLGTRTERDRRAPVAPLQEPDVRGSHPDGVSVSGLRAQETVLAPLVPRHLDLRREESVRERCPLC